MSKVQDEADLGLVEVSSRNEDGSTLLEEDALSEDNHHAVTEDAPGDLLQDWQENGEKERKEGVEEDETQDGNETENTGPVMVNHNANEGIDQGQKYERPSSADGSISMSDDGPSIQVGHTLTSNKSFH